MARSTRRAGNNGGGNGSGKRPREDSWEERFYGAVTVGERGQVVIPADARRRFGIAPGDKILILADPAKHALMLCKIDALREFMDAFREGLARVEQQMTDGGDAPAGGDEGREGVEDK